MKKFTPKIIILSPQSEIDNLKKLNIADEVTSYLDDDLTKYNNCLVIRFGAGWEPTGCNEAQNEFKYSITHWKDIALNVRKNESIKKISEAVNTPKIYNTNDKLPKNKLFVYRPISHSRGDGFKVIKGGIKVEFNRYATEFVKTDKEIRAWYCGNRVICARRMTKSEKRLSEKFKCRSLWNYGPVWKKTPKNLKKQVLKAAKHIGFKYGAFDIIWNKKTQKWMFLENNSQPAVDTDFLIRFYRNGLKTIINRKIKQMKIDFKKNPPLESKFEVIKFNAGIDALKSLENSSIKINQPKNINIISNKPSFISRILNVWNNPLSPI